VFGYRGDEKGLHWGKRGFGQMPDHTPDHHGEMDQGDIPARPKTTTFRKRTNCSTKFHSR